ncbi:MAG: NADH-quinone oxidoreductase subunit A [Candidatus Eremiobacteraeota bacterium]|nr:NADH-quinone oxidoreductase subunit A [Candidatus Eremiobacteraeota bacterium]
MEHFGEYGYVAVFLLGGLGFVAFNFGLAAFITRLLSSHRPHASKLIAYECGEAPKTEAWVQYNVRYYIFAMLFVLFDVEAAFLIPWAVGFKTMVAGSLGLLALVEMLVFLTFLAIALIYAWKKGALEWV